MSKRITRLCVETLNYHKDGSYGVGSYYKWTRGSELIRTIWSKLCLWELFKVSYEDFLDMVRTCKENSNVIMDIDNHTTIQVRRWSYHKKD